MAIGVMVGELVRTLGRERARALCVRLLGHQLFPDYTRDNILRALRDRGFVVLHKIAEQCPDLRSR